MRIMVAGVCTAMAGMALAIWMESARGQASAPAGTGAAATTQFVMPASMAAVVEPAAIKTQREALTQVTGKKPVASTVIQVAKLEVKQNGTVGTRRDLFDGPTVTLNNMEGHISTLNPGQLSHPPHQHVNEEMVIVMEGSVEVTINGKTTTAEKGDMMFFASLDWHNVRNAGTVPAMYYVLNWSAPLKPVAATQPAK